MNKSQIKYPKVRRDETVVDTFYGISVHDPYRWLEESEADEVKNFVGEQSKLTIPYLESCVHRKEIHQRLTEFCNYPKYTCPVRMGYRYFFFKNSGLQNHMDLYVQDTLESKAKVFLDVNSLSQDGHISLHSYSFSEDGEIFAYGLSKCGSDWFTIHFKNVSTRKNYNEVLDHVKFSNISWTHDNLGIFYACYSKPMGKSDGTETTMNENQNLYYHRLGTLQHEDVLIAEFPLFPTWRLPSVVSHCGDYLLIMPWQDCRNNTILCANLEPLRDGLKNKLEFKHITSNFDADYRYVTNIGTKFYFLTNNNAPNYRIVRFDLHNCQQNNWTTIVAQHSHHVLKWAHRIATDLLVVCYIQDVKNKLKLLRLADGHLIHNFELEVGTITGNSAKRWDNELFFKLENFLTPGKIFHVNLAYDEYKLEIFREIKQSGFNSSNYITKQIFYPSKDGTMIPMYIVCRKDLELTGNNYCRLYGYGGFNISKMPTFFSPRLVMLEHLNEVFALANIRGGEYGSKWYNDGTRLQKQNSFDDFLAAAEYLISNKYTNPSNLAIQGGSNGGLLMGACVNQRPELFGAALVQVGVLDMLRYQKFTVGFAWSSDYGSVDEGQQHFENLYQFSPLHNVQVPQNDHVQYPAMLISTATNDDRVSPLHSFKYLAQLQHVLGQHPKQTNQIMLKVHTDVGHVKGKSLTKVIEEYTDIISFLIQALGLTFKVSSSTPPTTPTST